MIRRFGCMINTSSFSLPHNASNVLHINKHLHCGLNTLIIFFIFTTFIIDFRELVGHIRSRIEQSASAFELD